MRTQNEIMADIRATERRLAELLREYAASTNLDILAIMKRIEPAASNGAAVSIRAIRLEANDRETVDAELIRLAIEGTIALHARDHHDPRDLHLNGQSYIAASIRS
jgi:hypothetical protein